MTDLSAEFYLLTLPCDCVVDLDANEDWVWSECRNYTECPWCAVVYDAAELAGWFHDKLEVAFSGAIPNPIIRFGMDVLEIVDTCDCGDVVARLRPGSAMKHLTMHWDVLHNLLLRN